LHFLAISASVNNPKERVMHDGMRRQLGRLAVAIGLLVALAGCVVAPYGPGYHGYYHGYGDHGGYGDHYR
jgi:hypothetical protein